MPPGLLGIACNKLQSMTQNVVCDNHQLGRASMTFRYEKGIAEPPI
jgi:hypothetical protein